MLKNANIVRRKCLGFKFILEGTNWFCATLAAKNRVTAEDYDLKTGE